MRVDSLPTLLKAASLPRIVFLFGEEEFLMHEAFDLIMKNVEKRGVSDFNIDVIDGDDSNADRLVQLASSFPMMGDMRVVVVKRFEKMVGGRKAKGSEKTPLGQYIQNPSPQSCVVLMVSSDSSANDDLKGISAVGGSGKQAERAQARMKKLKFPYNLLLAHSDWMEFPRLYDRMIIPWIVKRFAQSSSQINNDAAEYILARCGNSLREIANEIDKILIFTNNAKQITLETIMQLVGDSREYNVFELQKAIGERAFSKALHIMHHMLNADRQEMLILTVLTRYMLSLWKLADASRLYSHSNEIAEKAGIQAFLVPEYLGVLQRYSVGEIEQALIALRDADRKLKTSSEDSMLLMERMLHRIVVQNEAQVIA